MFRFTIPAILILLTAIACTRQVPQLPANKASEADSSSATLQLANEKLISGEDSLIQDFVRKSSVDFKKSDSGLWYKIYSLSNSKNKPSKGDNCKINYQVYSLDNKLLMDQKKSLIIGKKQVVNGIEELILNLSTGDSAVAVVPWYIGYGIKGNANIAPYTSVFVRLKRLR